MPGVAAGETPDGGAVRVQALKSGKGVNFLRPVFGLKLFSDRESKSRDVDECHR